MDLQLSRRHSLGFLASISFAAMSERIAFAQRLVGEARERVFRTVDTRIGRLDFELGVPTPRTVEKLYDEMDFQRAVLCYLWATPIVGMEGVKQALADNAGAKSGDVVVAEGYRDVSVMLGSNLTTPYMFVVLDLASEGPMTVEYPAGATASSLIDWWDRPIEDLGLPGSEKGTGTTVVVVGPGQADPTDVPGRIFRSQTFNVLLFGRVLELNHEKGQALLKHLRVYPHRQASRSDGRVLRFKTSGDLTSMGHPRGMAYWERLASALQKESSEDRDRFFAAMLKPLGLEKGQPFTPNQRQRALLSDAAAVGEAMAKASAFSKRFPGMRYRPDTHWELLIPPLMDFGQDVPDSTLFEERTAFFYEVMGASQAAATKTPGVGSAYLSAYHEKDGGAFDGGRQYRLRVPPNPPAKLFWSITLYDVDTRCLIQNKQEIADRSSRHDLVKNADGSVDVIFGPTAPANLEKNWIPTTAGKAWFAYFRLFGPLEPYFDRSWRLPDIELATS